jgi:tRNA pseudouridine55 synthase
MPHFGILNVNKPSGCSSRRVVDRIEPLVRPAKVGHAGTLDPLATGVLVVCVGQATRLISYVQRMPKQYRATFLLGFRSETDDVESTVLEVIGAPHPSRQLLEGTLSRFQGVIDQVPPAHSAVKVGGRRAYKLARAGKSVELSPRRVTILQLTIRRYEYPELELDIECGSGTYVRSLGRDLATAVGTSAVMSALDRMAIGKFRIEESLALDDITADAIGERLQPALAAVADLPRIAITEAERIELHHGRPIRLSPFVGKPKQTDIRNEWAAVSSDGRLLAILRATENDELWPTVNFDAIE